LVFIAGQKLKMASAAAWVIIHNDIVANPNGLIVGVLTAANTGAAQTNRYDMRPKATSEPILKLLRSITAMYSAADIREILSKKEMISDKEMSDAIMSCSLTYFETFLKMLLEDFELSPILGTEAAPVMAIPPAPIPASFSVGFTAAQLMYAKGELYRVLFHFTRGPARAAVCSVPQGEGTLALRALRIQFHQYQAKTMAYIRKKLQTIKLPPNKSPVNVMRVIEVATIVHNGFYEANLSEDAIKEYLLDSLQNNKRYKSLAQWCINSRASYEGLSLIEFRSLIMEN
jgi:hypothetical protein